MKAVIQRKLDLSVKYVITDKKYIPLENGCGLGCDNCGKLIANIATVQSRNGSFNIGFDCLETVLLNNSLLYTGDILEYERTKKMIPKVLRFSKVLKELISLNNGLDGFSFDRPNGSFLSDVWITYYLLKGNSKPYNTNVKLKDVDFDFLITTLKAIFKNHIIKINI